MTLETQYNRFLHSNPDTTFSFNEWMKWHSHQMEQAIIKMMQDDEELGLYDYDWCKGNVVLPREEIKLEDVFNDGKKENIKKFIDEIKNPSQPNKALKDAAQRLEKYSERFDNKDNEIVEGIFNSDNWGERLVKEPKQETLHEVALEFAKDHYEMYETSNLGSMHFGFIEGAKWREKQYTIEEQHIGHSIDDLDKSYIKGFNEGAEWQAERSYSEEEVIDIAKQAFVLGKDFGLIGTFNEWFEQFKKK